MARSFGAPGRFELRSTRGHGRATGPEVRRGSEVHVPTLALGFGHELTGRDAPEEADVERPSRK